MSHPRGASSFENINRQGPSSVQSVTADTSSHMALEINLETSGHAAQENQNQTYESKCSLFISCTYAVTQTKWHMSFRITLGKVLQNRLFHLYSNLQNSDVENITNSMINYNDFTNFIV